MSEPKVQKTEQEWREELSPERYNVLREAGTEPPFSGEYTYSKDDGMFRCGACGNALFSSDSKFDSGTGWPSFTEPAVAEAVELKEDSSHFMRRTEVLCANCGSHLGHVVRRRPRADRPALLHQLPLAGPRAQLRGVARWCRRRGRPWCCAAACSRSSRPRSSRHWPGSC